MCQISAGLRLTGLLRRSRSGSNRHSEYHVPGRAPCRLPQRESDPYKSRCGFMAAKYGAIVLWDSELEALGHAAARRPRTHSLRCPLEIWLLTNNSNTSATTFRSSATSCRFGLTVSGRTGRHFAKVTSDTMRMCVPSCPSTTFWNSNRRTDGNRSANFLVRRCPRSRTRGSTRAVMSRMFTRRYSGGGL